METDPKIQPGLKMRELEQATGVGRETIRFYIREGLLPEPERPKRNVARYSDVHVARLKSIKKLQQERFLPLNVIKTIVKAQDGEPASGIESFVGLENALYPLLGDPEKLEPRRLVDVAADSGFEIADVDELVSLGFVNVDERDGERWLDSRNARIVALWRGIRDAGFSEEKGYTSETWSIYGTFMSWLVNEEVNSFYNNLVDQVDQSEAATMAAEGIRIMNEIIPLMRTDRVIRAVEEISQSGELPGVGDEDDQPDD
jgi:DNA-binding transcriptional MerR regulator